jgi:hypothetical protein
MNRGRLHCLLLVLSIAVPFAAWAAGGAHIVDDSDVESPGTCHAEFWVTRFVPGDGYANAAPACTMEKVPWLEIGAAYQHYWDQVTGAPLFGPQFKVNFQPESEGIGVGLGFNAGVNLQTGALGFASLIALVSFPINEKVKVNLNAGWSYLNADTPDALFYGGQLEAKVGWDLSLMLEAFGRVNGLVGNQAGLRYTPHDGNIDFDLLVGTYYDATSTRFFTMGVTVRF